nr:hypothetical protein [Tanacetum cinerariifolium]
EKTWKGREVEDGYLKVWGIGGGYGAGLFWGRWGIMGRSGVRVVEWSEEWGEGSNKVGGKIGYMVNSGSF